jgi:hypothetical protein
VSYLLASFCTDSTSVNFYLARRKTKTAFEPFHETPARLQAVCNTLS